MGDNEFKDCTTEQLEETLKCINFLVNMEFSGLIDQRIMDFYSRVEKELESRKVKV